MTHLIIGKGEVGKALVKVLSPHYKIKSRDINDILRGSFDVLHIAYPWQKNFARVTKRYIREYSPRLVIIHATVPVGTTKNIGKIAAHSPVRGEHPNLAKGIKTFVKYFGGQKAKEAAKIFQDIGIRTKTFKKAETTELGKILDTTYYAWNIIFAKEVARVCKERGLDFDEVYTIPNTDYNEGYKKLGRQNVIRSILKPTRGPIGGHCLIPNAKLLESWVTKVIRERNKTYKKLTKLLTK